MRATTEFSSTLGWIAPVLIAALYIFVNSFLREPHRRTFNAIMLAGAGAAYLSGGGFGLGEVAFTMAMAPIAWLGLRSYRFLAIGWLLHAAWDVAHHLYGNPLLPFDPTSSLGCAICDPVLALWFFAGAPSMIEMRRRQPAKA
jgi:hypothetical protein